MVKWKNKPKQKSTTDTVVDLAGNHSTITGSPSFSMTKKGYWKTLKMINVAVSMAG